MQRHWFLLLKWFKIYHGCDLCVDTLSMSYDQNILFHIFTFLPRLIFRYLIALLVLKTCLTVVKRSHLFASTTLQSSRESVWNLFLSLLFQLLCSARSVQDSTNHCKFFSASSSTNNNIVSKVFLFHCLCYCSPGSSHWYP